MSDVKKTTISKLNEGLVVDTKVDETVENARTAVTGSYKISQLPILEKLEADVAVAKKKSRTAPETVTLTNKLEEADERFVIVVGNSKELSASIISDLIEKHEISTGKKVLDGELAEIGKQFVAEFKALKPEDQKKRTALYDAVVNYKNALAAKEMNSNIDDYKKSLASVENNIHMNFFVEQAMKKDYVHGQMDTVTVAKFIHDFIGTKRSSGGDGTKKSFEYIYEGFEHVNSGSNVSRVATILKEMNAPDFSIIEKSKDNEKYVIMASGVFSTTGYSSKDLKAKVDKALAGVNSKLRVPSAKRMNKATGEQEGSI